MVDHWLINVLSYGLPQACELCGNEVPHGQALALCHDCVADLPILGETCQRCANPLETRLERLEHFLDQASLLQTRQCGQCIGKQPFFDQTISFFPYIAPFNHLIQAAKFKGKLALARLLGQLMAAQLTNCLEQIGKLPDGLLPVPLHPSRQRARGYNQSLEIALPISKRLHIPILNQLAIRITATPPQTSLPLKQRKQNLLHAFKVNNDVSVRHIAIIDDVMTSGATVNALAKALKQAGVEKVSVWSLSRAEPPS